MIKRNTENDLSKDLIPLPKAMIGLFSVVSLTNLTPSKGLLTFEPVIELHCFLLVYSLFATNKWCLKDFDFLEKSSIENGN